MEYFGIDKFFVQEAILLDITQVQEEFTVERAKGIFMKKGSHYIYYQLLDAEESCEYREFDPSDFELDTILDNLRIKKCVQAFVIIDNEQVTEQLVVGVGETKSQADGNMYEQITQMYCNHFNINTKKQLQELVDTLEESKKIKLKSAYEYYEKIEILNWVLDDYEWVPHDLCDKQREYLKEGLIS